MFEMGFLSFTNGWSSFRLKYYWKNEKWGEKKLEQLGHPEDRNSQKGQSMDRFSGWWMTDSTTLCRLCILLNIQVSARPDWIAWHCKRRGGWYCDSQSHQSFSRNVESFSSDGGPGESDARQKKISCLLELCSLYSGEASRNTPVLLPGKNPWIWRNLIGWAQV